VGRVIWSASTIRRTGASVLDLCYVAQGAYDGYIDVRERLTPENFLAPSLILAEAGGELVDPVGRPLGPVEFTRPYSVLATGTPELLEEILVQLRQV
jgi:myo-inositol-1(or 4)-monophosphatase